MGANPKLPQQTSHDIVTVSHFSTLGYDDGDFGFVIGPRGNVFDLSHNQQSFDDAAEDHVFRVQKVTFGARDEELAAVGVFARVGHGEQTGARVLQSKVFIGEIGSVDAHGAGAVAVDKVPALDHKVLDDPMKLGVFEAGGHAVAPEFPRAELPEILGGSRHDVGE